MSLTETEILQTLMQWRPRVSAAAWVVVRDSHAAEDIFQNVALKALTRDVVFEAEAALVSWAFITARREGIDWLRRHQREATSLDHDLLEVLEQEWQADTAPRSSGKLEALKDCLEGTPEVARELLRWRYFEGLSCEEVAGRMGLGLTVVYKRISRLHEQLRQCVEARLGGHPLGHEIPR
jgi:RNA polymerase sigma-70 factor (ECF subfamily)